MSVFKEHSELFGFSNFIYWYYGRIEKYYYIADKVWDFLIWTKFVDFKNYPTFECPQVNAYFIDGSSKDIEGIHGPDIHQSINTFFPQPNKLVV